MSEGSWDAGGRRLLEMLENAGLQRCGGRDTLGPGLNCDHSMNFSMNFEKQARLLVTEKCLIATDVDQTILAQTPSLEEEKLLFFRRMAPELVEAARLGVHIGFITGNSMNELCLRVLDFLVEQLCYTGDLAAITRFHFFCNSGGVYFRFPETAVEHAINRSKEERGHRLRRSFWHAVIMSKGDGLFVHPQFVDPVYVERCLIEEDHAQTIETILRQIAEEYRKELDRNLEIYDQQYDLARIKDQDGRFKACVVEPRSAAYRNGPAEKSATVQITLKPILSFRQAREGRAQELFGNDLRSQVVNRIQERLDGVGLGQYVARPGGRASIDVTLERLDKAYALEFLIDRLRVQGSIHRGEQFGSNTIYFGDEVIVGAGNDYPVTRIPGLLVLAVNRDRQLVPSLRHVLVPSAIFEGPEATADVLMHFNQCARRLIKGFRSDHPPKTAIQVLKEEIFADRIVEKVNGLRSQDVCVEDWQTLHTFVTLMAQEKGTGKQCLSLVARELDAIMTQLAVRPSPSAPAAGATRSDG